MSDPLDDRVTLGERYVRAATSGNLRMREGHCDAETLLAAGYALGTECARCAGTGRVDQVRCTACFGAGRIPSPRKTLGLRLYRLQVVGDMSDLAAIETEAMAMLQGRLGRGGNRPMPERQRAELVLAVLRWWVNQTCAYCGGQGFEKIDGAPGLSAVACVACNGEGRTPLKRVLPRPLLDHGAWLARELDMLCAMVIGDMAAVLRRGMEP